MRKNNSGITLIEIAVVMFIVLLILGIALPDFNKLFSKIETDAATRQIYRALLYAKSASITRGLRYKIKFNHVLSRLSFWVEDAPEYFPGKFSKSRESPERTIRLPDGIQLKTSADEIIFKPDGTSTGLLLDLISNVDRKISIEVNKFSSSIKIHENKT